MAQHDYDIANQSGANFRSDLNNALDAIVSNNSGSSEPSTTFAYEWWIDTSNNLLKLRNSANNAWITLPLSITADNSTSGGLTVNGNLATTGTVDINGQELILDADADTSITADTDDQIDIKIAGADVYTVTASSFDFNGKELILDADADSSITADTDDQIDIKIGGTDVMQITNSSSDLVLKNPVQDKDILFKGNDGGSEITAFTLDMSASGRATFNGDVIMPRYLEHTGDSDTFIGFPSDDTFVIYTGAERVRVDSSGNFLHGGTSAFTTGVTSLRSRTLSGNDFAEVTCGGEYATTDTYLVYDTTNNATRFKVNYQGTIFATSTTITSLSDGRLKENIRELDKGLDDILKLKPIRFDWKAEEGSGKKDVSGFIAQECEEAGFEEFVDTYKFNNEMQDAKSFGYSGLIPALVKAIQELEARVQALEE